MGVEQAQMPCMPLSKIRRVITRNKNIPIYIMILFIIDTDYQIDGSCHRGID